METLPVPSLRDEDIVAMRCGIRPHRRGRVRVEREAVFGKTVVHNYGHGGAGVTLSWGTAEEAARLALGAVDAGPASALGRRSGLSAPNGIGDAARDPDLRRGASSGPASGASGSSRDPIAVLGAGVVGLTTAHELAKAGRRVRVYAREVAHQTTSALAGALWLPTGVAWGETDAEKRTFLGWLRTAKFRFLEQMGQGGWGVRLIPLWEPGTQQQDPRFFRDGIVDDWRTIERLPLAGAARVGQHWTALFIDTPIFLDRLKTDLRAAGVEFVDRTFERAEQIADLPEAVVVNCLGLGAREVWKDSAMLPVRGHLIHMRPQPIDYIYHANYTYMFPRQSALVLGGSYEEGIDDPRVDESICRRILEKHRAAYGM